KQQREVQALYLVTTGSFSGERFTLDQGTSTLFEGAAGMLSDILSGDNSRFNVGVSYQQGQPQLETGDQIGLTISSQISERIIVNGKVGVPVGGVRESVLAGDI